MEEKSKEDAENYYKHHRLTWQVVFENIDDSNSMRAKLGMHVYSIFFLVNEFGEIIYKHSTSNGIESMEEVIRKSINNSAERE